MINIDNQSTLNEIISIFPWHDSFIREAYTVSPSYVKKDGSGVIAPNSLWGFRLLICSCEKEFPAIELVFEEVEQIVLSGSVELNPHGKIDGDLIEIFLTESDPAPISARRLYYKFWGIEMWGEKVHYSDENLFDEFGFWAAR